MLQGVGSKALSISRLAIVAGAVGLVALLLGCAGGQPSAASAPPPRTASADVPLAARLVWDGTYDQNIQPIFDQYCIACHGPTLADNGLRLDSYANTMRGTKNGPVVVAGSPGTSTLVAVIQGTADPSIKMPHDKASLSKNRIQNIILWIEAGAKQ